MKNSISINFKTGKGSARGPEACKALLAALSPAPRPVFVLHPGARDVDSAALKRLYRLERWPKALIVSVDDLKYPDPAYPDPKVLGLPKDAIHLHPKFDGDYTLELP